MAFDPLDRTLVTLGRFLEAGAARLQSHGGRRRWKGLRVEHRELEFGHGLRRAESCKHPAGFARRAQLNEYGAHGEAAAVATAGEGLVWAGVARASVHGGFRKAQLIDCVVRPRSRRPRFGHFAKECTKKARLWPLQPASDESATLI